MAPPSSLSSLLGDLRPVETIVKLFLLQTALFAIGALFFAKLSKVWGRRRYTPLSSGAVLLTGTSSGIGKTAAVYLARKGFVILAGVRKQADADSLRGLGEANIRPVMIDVAKPESIEKCVKEVKAILSKEGIPLVAIINNAGLLQDATVEFHDMGEMKKMFDVNVFGVIAVTQKFLPLIRESKGRVINVGSVSGKVSFPRFGAYAASKHAIEAINDALRAELTPAGCSVSLIQDFGHIVHYRGKEGSIPILSTYLPTQQPHMYFHTYTQPGFCRTELFIRGMSQQQSHVAETNASAEAKEAYPKFYTDRFEKKNRRPMENGSDPIVVCQAMHHALSDPYPQTRYPVAKINRADVGVVFLVRSLLPDRVFDAKFLLND